MQAFVWIFANLAVVLFAWCYVPIRNKTYTEKYRGQKRMIADETKG